MAGVRSRTGWRRALTGALFESLENRRLLSSTFTHVGASAMVYDAAGNLHFTWYDTSTKSLKYAERNASGVWSARTTVDGGPNVGSSLAIAIDSSGDPGIAYYDASHADLKYAHFNGQSWNTSRVDTAGTVGQNPSLVFDRSSHPLVSYFDQSNSDLKLAAFDGAHWNKTVIDRQAGAGQFSSIAINPIDGTWAMAYDETSQRQVRYATQSGKRQTRATMGQSSSWTADPSLAFTANGAPAVGFFDPAAQTLQVAQFGKVWVTLLVASGNIGTQLALSFDARTGDAQIGYCDLASGAIDLATNVSGHWSTVKLGSGAGPTIARDTVTNRFAALVSGASGSTVSMALADPSNLVASVISNARVDLTWTDNSTIETGFVIERSANGASFSSLANVGANVTTYSDLNVIDGQSYVYRVKAVDLTSASLFAMSQSAMTTLNAPTGLSAVSNTDGTVHLAWQNSSVGTTGFRVEISSDGVSFGTQGQTNAGTTQFDDLSTETDQTFYYRIVPFNALGDGPASTVLLVHTAPAAPSGLRVFGEGPTQFELIWTQLSGSATHILVQGRLAGTNDAFQTIDTLTADQISDLMTLGPDGNLLAANTAYEFRLVATNVDGDPSAESAHAQGSTGLIAPENLTAQSLSATSASMMWDANSGGATNYNVYISTDGTSYSLYSHTYQQASSLLLPDLLPSTHYWLKVTATDGTNESAGAFVQVDTQAGSPGASPINVLAQISEDNPLHLNISWTNVATDAIGFHIQRSTDGVHFTTIEDVPVTWATYDDPSVVEGTYYYRIQAFTASGDAGVSHVTSATAFLADPINLQATATSAGTVNLAWTNVSTLATGLQLYAADELGNPILVDSSVAPTATSYSVTQFADGTPLTDGATYWFYLVPTGDISSFSSSQWVRITNGFGAPAEIDVTPSGAGQMTISWADVSDETGYQIESSSDGVHFNFVATVDADVTSYVDSDLPETSNLYYRVEALGSSGDSSYTVSARTAVSPNAPTNLVVTPIAGGSFQLTWDDNSSNEDGYAVSFTTTNGDVFIPAQLAPNATSCTITEADLSGMGLPGRDFAVKVVAFRWWGASSSPAEVDSVQAI